MGKHYGVCVFVCRNMYSGVISGVEVPLPVTGVTGGFLTFYVAFCLRCGVCGCVCSCVRVRVCVCVGGMCVGVHGGGFMGIYDGRCRVHCRTALSNRAWHCVGYLKGCALGDI